MAARRLNPDNHGYYIRESGTVTLTRPRLDIAQDALTDMLAALQLLGEGAVYTRVPWPMLWTRLCDAMHAWLVQHEADRAALVRGDRRQWVAHRELVMKGTLGLCLAMRFSRKQWIRGHFQTLLKQHGVHTAVELAGRVALTHAQPASVVYIGFSYCTSRPYIGMVQSRDPWLRFSEHWAKIADHQSGLSDPREAKYSYMASQGGVDRWHFLPLVVSSVVLSRYDLHRLEKLVWSRYPTRLNGMRPGRSGSRAKVLPDNSPTSNTMTRMCAGKSKHGGLPPVFSGVLGHEGGTVRGGTLEPNLEQALRSYPGVSWHTSAPHAVVMVKRLLGASLVVVRQHEGGCFAGRLRNAIKWTQQMPGSWVTLTFLSKKVKLLQRGEDYEFLLALARHEVPTSEAEDLLVE